MDLKINTYLFTRPHFQMRHIFLGRDKDAASRLSGSLKKKCILNIIIGIESSYEMRKSRTNLDRMARQQFLHKDI